MMTAYVVFEYLKKGQATLDDILPVSEKAWVKHKTGKSKMFVPLGARVKIEDLVARHDHPVRQRRLRRARRGHRRQQPAFVERMNEKAQGDRPDRHAITPMSTACPIRRNTRRARDLAMLARHLIPISPSTTITTRRRISPINGIKQGNRNPLLYKDLGADGLKTGHTEEAGLQPHRLGACATAGGSSSCWRGMRP